MQESNSFSTYRKIYPYRVNWITWTFIGGAGVMLYIQNIFYENPYVDWIAVSMLGVSLLRYLIQYIHQLISYKKFKDFHLHLGFELTGWEKLMENPERLKPQHWSLNCSIDIETNNFPEHDKYVSDALFLFIQDAHQRYYKTGYGSGRKEWKFISDKSASGSIDVAVSGDIYHFLEFYLKPIHKKYNNIKSVKINWDDQITFVKFLQGAT